MESMKDRPVATCGELCASGAPGGAPRFALLKAGEFLKMVAMISGHEVTRRTLQFYSSPKLRLLPKPLYFRGHVAYYSHPEYTVRLALLLHLRSAYFLPLELAKIVLDGLSEDHYGLILDDVLSASDIVRLARDGEPREWLRDALTGRASRALQAAELLENGRISPAGTAEAASAIADQMRIFSRSGRASAREIRPA